LGCSHKEITYKAKVLKAKKLPNIDLFYKEAGEGEVFLMLHGFGSSSSSFKYIIPTLSQQYHIYAPDLKGFGKSPKPRDGKYSVYDQYLVIKSFIKKHHIKNPIVLGHSMGGSIALLLALDKEIGVKKLILLDTPAYKQSLPKLLRYANIPIIGSLGFYILSSHYEVLDGYRYAFYDDTKIPQEMVDELAKDLSSKNAKYAFLETNKELIPDDIDKISKRYSEIDIPTLLIWGYNDIVVRKSKAYKLNKDIKNSRLRFIYKCGHLPQEEKPKETLKLIKKFLD
jgi:pimeloyl-ACP methyl ester carboxylesterase